MPQAVPGVYHSPYGNSIVDLIMRQGDIAANRAYNTSQIWGNAIANAGQQVGQVLQQRKQEKQQRQTEDFINQTMLSYDGSNDIDIYKQLLPRIGPKAANEIVGGLSSIYKMHKGEQPDEKHLAATVGLLNRMEQENPGYIQRNWDTVKTAVGPLSSLGIQVPEAYSPEIPKMVATAAKQFNPEKPTAPEKPEPVMIDGRPTLATPSQIASAQQGGSRVEPYVKPEKSLQEIEAESAARARGTASVAAGQLGSGIGVGGGNYQLTGEEFLKTLPPNVQQTVKKVANYEVDLAKVASLRGGKGQSERSRLIAMVAQYDPSYDMTQFAARNKLRSEFTSGTAAKNLVALNTAERHIQTLERLEKELPQSDIQLINKLQGEAMSAFGSPAITNWDNAAQKVADEVNRAFVGAGSQAQEGIKRELQALKASQSPAQRQQAIATIREMLGGRREELKGQYERGMGKPLDLGFSITSGPAGNETAPSSNQWVQLAPNIRIQEH